MEDKTFEHLVVVKRSGQRVPFNEAKIAIAIKHAFDNTLESDVNANEKKINKVYNLVLDYIMSVYKERKTINVEDIQDIIENTLKKTGYEKVYKAFNDYRLRRAASREAFSIKEQHKFVKAIEKIGLTVKNNNEDKPFDLMFKFGKTISQEFAKAYLIESKYVRAHEEGRIYINNMDSIALGVTASSHLDLRGVKAKSLALYTNKLLAIIRNFKEEQYLEQTICNIDLLYKPIMIRAFKDSFGYNLQFGLKVKGIIEYLNIEKLLKVVDDMNAINYDQDMFAEFILNEESKKLFAEIYDMTLNNLQFDLGNSLRTLFKNLVNLKNRFSSNLVSISLSEINDYETILFKKEYIKVLNEEEWPNIITIGKIKDDCNLLVESMPKNIQLLFLNSINYDDDLESFSDGTIINTNVNGEDATSLGKILISEVTINLARIGLKYHCQNLDDFYEELNEILELVKAQLLQRYEIQANKLKENFSYIYQNEWLYDAKKLEENQKVRKVIRSGTFNINYVGLGECLESLLNKDSLDKNDMSLGLDILNFMNKKIKQFAIDNKLNFNLCENQNPKIAKYLLTIDKSMYGNINILKKNKYGNISDYLEKLDFSDSFKLTCQFQNLTNMVLKINLPRNCSKDRYNEVVKNMMKENLKVVKVRLGNDDN